MTIKELEQQTGMARANIRFYEGEGLLAPKRLENGYRDYSEEDARTLEKIQLLRRLQLDIDAIRKVQAGALTLEQALFTQLTKLEGDRAVMERAAAVCRELERSGVEYAALEPRPWLARLQPPETPVRLEPPPPPPEPEPDQAWAPPACGHPWQRWLARTLDMTIYDTVINTAWLMIFGNQIRVDGVIAQWLLSLGLLALALVLEPLWLHYWGWTPGKWVFGLKLRCMDGGKLPLAWALDRTWRLAWDGYGLNIPLYDLWRFWKNRKDALDGWDGSWNQQHACRYTKEERRFSGWIFAGANALCLAVLLLGILYARFPVNRGGLTVEEFSQNYNHYFKHLVRDQRSTGMPTLDGDGRWVEGRRQDSLVIGDVMNEGSTRWDDPAFTLRDGRVTAVALHVESTDEIVFDLGTRELLALLALSGSTEGLTMFNYDLRGWAQACLEPMALWEDTEFTYRGLRVTVRAEAEGYEPGSGGNLWGVHGEPHRCEKTVTISLAEQS